MMGEERDGDKEIIFKNSKGAKKEIKNLKIIKKKIKNKNKIVIF